MNARLATPDEIARWDELIVNNPDGGNIFASTEYATMKKTGGYKVHYVMVDDIAVTVLEKSTPPLGKLWYLPKGPEVTSVTTLSDVLEALKPLAKKYHVFAIRFESELPRTKQPALARSGFRSAKPIIPNPSTILLDISKPLDKLLLELPQKGRYAIRRAERDGVTVKAVKPTEKNCKTMYKLLKETAEGQFGVRDYWYYQKFWQHFYEKNLGQLFFAYVDGKEVAGAYAMVLGKKSTYKDGASIRKRTAYGASHLLQWHVIEWAKSRGAELHDFCGSPPSDEIDNPEHPHYGIGLFKTAFNKEVTDYIGCYDLVLNKVNYQAWLKLGERVFRHYYWKKHHDYYY